MNSRNRAGDSHRTRTVPRNRSDNLFIRTVRVARLNVKELALYFASVSALLGGLAYLGYNKNSLGSWEVSIGVALTLFPLLFTFCFQTLPAWRATRRTARLRDWSVKVKTTRAGYFRIGPYGDTADDQEAFARADHAHELVLKWIRHAQPQVLYLSGASGVGKTSLLNAYVIPQLRSAEPQTRVLVLSSYDDSLLALATQLRTNGVIWKQYRQQAEGEEDLPVTLRRSCDYLQAQNVRLLLVFDQFERLLLLRTREPQRVQDVSDFLQDISKQPIPNLTVMLSLRTEYEGMLSYLGLPGPRLDENWFKVSAFDETAARDFLAGGFAAVGVRLLDAALAEASAVEEARGLIRPITLNMLGDLFRRSSNDLSRFVEKIRSAERGTLLTDDLRQSLDAEDVCDHARPLLTAMLTDGRRKPPSSITLLCEWTTFDEAAIHGCLLKLLPLGVVRCLDQGRTRADQIWEISHDFVARLLTLILTASTRSRWRRIRPLIAPSAIILWVIGFLVVLPDVVSRSQQAVIRQLSTKYGVAVKQLDANAGYQVECGGAAILPTALQSVSRLLISIDGPIHLHITDSSLLIDLNQLAELTKLQTLTLDDCQRVRTLDGLRTCTKLEKLDLDGCYSLANLDALADLRGLRSIRLVDAIELQNVNGIRGLGNLDALTITGSNVADFDGVNNLTNLEFVDFTGCTQFHGERALENVPKLQIVDCSETPLHDLRAFKDLPSLQSLTARQCYNLQTLSGLEHLIKLETLAVNECESLENVDGLSGLPHLQVVSAHSCPKLRDISGLRDLPMLKVLTLGSDESIADYSPLSGLKQLRKVTLSFNKELEAEVLRKAVPEAVVECTEYGPRPRGRPRKRQQ
jgi:Leucine-rich repeat (LRR) protein